MDLTLSSIILAATLGMAVYLIFAILSFTELHKIVHLITGKRMRESGS